MRPARKIVIARTDIAPEVTRRLSASCLLSVALRSYLGMEVLDRAWANADLDVEEALRLAVEKVHRFRSGAE